MENGPSCEYDDDANNPLIDSPSKNYYKNGIVFSSSQYAPQTWLPSIPNAVPAGSFSVPVYVSGFTNIKSFTQSFKYDPAVMSYTGFSQDPLLSGAVNVTDNAADANGKKKIVMTWTGSSPQSVPDGDPLVKINFNYISGASSLTWDTNPDSCRYNDVNGNAYYDLPKSTYYRNGMVASHPAPLTAAWNATGTTGLPVTIPVLVWHFSTIGAFNFTLDYDPGVLTYQSAALVPPLGGTFTPVSVEPGRLTLAWSGTAASLADSSNLVNLTFLYNGGNSPLAWYATGTACGSAEGLAQPALYDLPKANYYVNGNAGPAPVVTNFSASTTAPAVGATVIFSDLSTGSPDSWNWSFSPSTYVYVDSTGPNSKNPHLQFMIATPVSVTLIASRGMSSNVAMKSDYLQFGIPGLWTGNTSAAWNTGTNWDDQNVPSGGTDVMIPASAVNWPVISGDLVLGTQCRSITLAGSASLLTVNGNFTISDGTPLTFNGPGTIKVSGNWSNAGIFTCGNGTLEFTGAASGTIQTGTNPIASVNNYTRSTFTATFNDITGGTPGPTGDNTHTDAPIGFSFNYFGVAYTTLRISSNGWLSLDQSGVDTSSYHNEYLFTSAQPEATLAPWWDHLLADGSTSISYKTTGTAPNRVFTAEYSGILSYNSGSDSRLTFEVKLYESINVIEFYYGTVVNHIHNALESASIGIEDLNGGPGHFIEATTGSRTTGVTNLKSSANWPTVNYRFTPPPEKETFYNLVESKTSGALNIPGTIVVNGTLSLH